MALNDPCTSGNPKKTTLDDMSEMYRYSMEGKLF
jgi:alcohol dehydrogenase class IV